MKLEATANDGRDVLDLRPTFNGESIGTRQMVQKVFELKERKSTRDLAFSAQAYLAKALAEYTVNQAEILAVKTVGFTGGVAYNKQITSMIERIVKNRGLAFVVPVQVPCGDGGSSFGQACAANLTFSKK